MVVRSMPPRPGIPLWAKWALSLSVAALLLLALIVFVNHNSDYGAEAPQNPQAVLRANQEGEVVVRQDQAPHVTAVPARLPARSAITRGVRREMAQLIGAGMLSGPLQHVSCTRAGGARAIPAFGCTAVAGSVNYDFQGAVDIPRRRLTLCKRDQPPVPSQNIPVSPRCRA